MTVKEKPADYLTIDWVLGQFSDNKKHAQKLFEDFVMEGINEDSPWKDLKKTRYFSVRRDLKHYTKRHDPRDLPIDQP